MERMHRWLIRHRWLSPTVWILLVALSIPSVLHLGSDFRTAGLGVPNSPSAQVQHVLGRYFPHSNNPTAVAIYYAPQGIFRPQAQRAIRQSLHRLDALPWIINPPHWSNLQVSPDRTTAAATLVLPRNRGNSIRDTALVPILQHRAAIGGHGVTAYITGLEPVVRTFTAAVSHDLREAELFTFPLTLVALILIFRSLVAPIGPLLAGFGGITLALAALAPISRLLPLAPEVEDAAAMIGLGVGIDYALMLVHRYRLARSHGLPPPDAAAEAATQAGRAVLFSGAIVASAFGIMSSINQPLLRSMGIGAFIAVLATMAAALTLLPSLLVISDRWLDWPFGHSTPPGRLWESWAQGVMRHPYWSLAAAMAILILLAMPARQIRLWNPGVNTLPASSQTRRGYDIWLHHNFPGIGGSVIVLAHRAQGFVNASGQRVLVRLSRRIQSVADVHGVDAPISPLLTHGLPRSLSTQLGDHARYAEILVFPQSRASSQRTQTLVLNLRRRLSDFRGAMTDVGGGPAYTVDVIALIRHTLPRLALGVAIATFLLLFWLFRSIALPVKAILLNILSVGAGLGMVTMVFQHGLLRPTFNLGGAGAVDWTTPVILFTVLFSLSTDYEVFLLSRVFDRHQSGDPDALAISESIKETGRIITGAALIMVTVFLAFGLIGLEFMQELGFGLGLAVLLDASLVRLVLVPAIMRILGRANWWPGRVAVRDRGH